MPNPFDDITDEQIANHYAAALDRVNLINAVVAVIQRNVDHLKIVVDWPFWTDEDMTPLNAAIAVDTTEFDNQFN